MSLSAILAIPSAVLAHYGDPNTPPGCAADEVKIKISGIDGDLCSPPCNASGACPADVPAGVTATPTCALHDGKGGKFCALVCTPGQSNGQCGPHASCKNAQTGGLCTFDDGPKPAASAHWVPIASPTFSAFSPCIDVGFDPSGKLGWAGAGLTGAKYQAIHSKDSGLTWEALNSSLMPTYELLTATAARSDGAVVISGIPQQIYSTDGVTFQPSKGLNGKLTPAQDAKVLPDGRFALMGWAQLPPKNGVLLSPDGAEWEWTSFNALLNYSAYPARYGAFPSNDVWYITAGVWDGDLKTTDGVRYPLSRHVTRTRDKGLQLELGVGSERPNEHNGFFAAIAKTTDGGKSWTAVYKVPRGGIYPNGIDCITTTHCIAVLEGKIGAKILVTRDGGGTWKESYYDPDPKASLMGVKMLSDTEAWACGGHVVPSSFEGRFWHTTDGGDTWTKEAIPGLYIISFDMVSAMSGYAVGLTVESGIELIKYRDNSSLALPMSYRDIA